MKKQSLNQIVSFTIGFIFLLILSCNPNTPETKSVSISEEKNSEIKGKISANFKAETKDIKLTNNDDDDDDDDDDGPSVIGIKSCKQCHIQEWRSWKETVMAQKASILCETCHGPGEYYSVYMKEHRYDYKREEAVKLGLVLIDKKLCIACHNAYPTAMSNKDAPKKLDFDYKSALEKGIHKFYPKRKPPVDSNGDVEEKAEITQIEEKPKREKKGSEENIWNKLHGQLSLEYRFHDQSSSDKERSLSEENSSADLKTARKITKNTVPSDNDLIQTFLLSYGNLRSDRFSWTLYEQTKVDYERVTADEGQNNRFGFYPYASLSDTYNHGARADILYGYVNFRDLGSIALLRGGRQQIYETPRVLHFDGARLDFKPFENLLDLEISAYGGVPVHLYEANQRGDFLIGMNASIHPFETTRLRADYLFLNEDYQFVIGRTFLPDSQVYEDVEEHFHSYSFWQDIGTHSNVYGKVTFRNFSLEEVLLQANYYQQEWDLSLQGSVYRLLSEQMNRTLFSNPYFPLLQEYVEYFQFHFLMSKGFGENFNIDLGYYARELIDNEDEGAYNHEFMHFFMTPGYKNIADIKGLDASVTLDYWRSQEDIQSYGIDIAYKPNKNWSMQIGTDYALYQYDYSANQELTGVQSYYFKSGYRLNENWDFKMSMNYDVDDDKSALKLRLIMTFNF